MVKCVRCGKETVSHTMSMFNTDIICIECADEEKTFPEYKHARKVEHSEVVKGNLNFKGVGLPEKYILMYKQRREKK